MRQNSSRHENLIYLLDDHEDYDDNECDEEADEEAKDGEVLGFPAGCFITINTLHTEMV